MKKLLVLPMSAITFAMAVSPAFAVSASSLPQMREERQELRQEMKQERVEMRCEVSDARVNLLVSRYTQNYPRHVENYKNVAEGVKTLVDSLKAAGKDTSKLEAVLATYNQKVVTFSQQATATVDQLKVAQQYACGESQGQYVAEIKKARELAATAHTSLLDLRSYYQKSVRPEIQALRAQQ
jgi:malonyl CoA-acyl carrier protein transacylase